MYILYNIKLRILYVSFRFINKMIVSYKSVWPYYSVHLLLLISIIALYVYNDVTFPLWILYGLIPVVDTIWPLDVINPT